MYQFVSNTETWFEGAWVVGVIVTIAKAKNGNFYMTYDRPES